MRVSIKKLPSSTAELQVALEKEEIAKYDEATYKHLVEQIDVPGFRKGKAPKLILLQHMGHEKYNHEFMEKAIPLAFFEAIHEEKLKTLTAPDIQLMKFVPGEELEFKATVALMPEVSLGDYKTIKVASKPIVVEESEIEGAIKNLRERMATHITKPQEQSIEKGDRAEIDFDVSVDGKPLDRGASKNHPLVVGENVFIPGFEDNLIGMKIGEEKEFELKFPDEYHEKTLSGKLAKFKVKINLVQKVDLPELNDEFAKRLGAFENLEALRKSIREGVEMEKNADETMRVQEETLNKLSEMVKIEIPAVLIAQEKEQLMKSLEDNLATSGLRLDQYLATIKKTYDELAAETEKEAERRLKVSLALTEVAKKEDINATDEETAEEKKKLIEAEHPDDEDTANIAANRVITQKVIKRLVDNAVK